jgi:predicted ATPase/class 3 adenylate cyclase
MVTFLFSDIEGSTLRWERDRVAMQDALARHDRVMHTVVASHGGYVFKTIGDQFCSAFQDAAQAVTAAAVAQERLGSEDWSAIDGLRVRMAVHSGVTDERDGDYYGPAVNRVARLMAISHGGQVLVSRVTAELLNGSLSPELTLKDLGEHRLRDLAQPEHVFQLQAPHLVAEFPPLSSLTSFKTNLPHQLASFIGREEHIDKVLGLLREARIVTLVGAAGIGKSRLALAVAGDLLPSMQDGVWYLDFANVVDAKFAPEAVADALGIALLPQRSAMEAVEAYLKDRHALLFFDNCARLLEAAGRIAESISRACSNVTILATSREPLKTDGEHIYYVPPLDLPESAPLNAEHALRSSAVALFVDRVQAVNPGFQLSDDNVDAVVEICWKLDGIALAIELIAPRTKILSLEAIASRLRERFSVVGAGRRTAPLRHQTLHALFDSSYETLDDSERSVFRRLGVFVGGASLDAVEAVCADESLGDNILDVLSTLVEKSLVLAEIGPRSERYRLLASLQEYALEHLGDSDERRAALERHARYFLAQAELADAAHDGRTPTHEWLQPLSVELDNFWAALTWCFGQENNAEVGQRIVAALRSFWVERDAAGGWHWAEVALDSLGPTSAPTLRAKLLCCQAALAIVMGQRAQALELANEAIEIARVRQDDNVLTQALRIAGTSLSFLTSPEEKEKLDWSQALLEEAARLAKQRANEHEGALALQALGCLERLRGNFEGGIRRFENALKLAQRCADERAEVITRGNLADAMFEAGDAQKALEHNAGALVLTEDRRHAVAHTHLLLNRSAYLIALSRFPEAHKVANQGLAMARDKQSPILIAGAIEHLAAIAAWHGQNATAARLLGFAESRYDSLDQRREYTEQREREWVLAQLRGRMTPSELETHLRQGAALSEDRAISEAAGVKAPVSAAKA